MVEWPALAEMPAEGRDPDHRRLLELKFKIRTLSGDPFGQCVP